MAIEIATAFVSLVASARGIAASIASELGRPLTREASKAGQKTGDTIEGAIRRSIGGISLPDLPDIAAPVIGQPVIKAPATDDIETAVVAAARRAAKKASEELALIPNVNARDFEATVAAAANSAAVKARAKLENIPAGIDTASLVRAAADAAGKVRSELGGITVPDIEAPRIGQPEIPAPTPLSLAEIGAPLIGQPEIPEPRVLKIPSLDAPKIGTPEIPPPDDSSFLSGAKKAGIAAGVAAGAGLAVGFVSAAGQEVSNDQLAGQLGINDPAFAKDLGKVAGRIYGNAFGDSVGEVNAGIRAVLQNGLLPEDATNAAIERVTTKVLGLATVFQQDLGGAAAAAGQLMRTGLAKNADEAIDVIVRGFQQGVDRSGDLLDTLNEYPTEFRQLGLSAADAVGILRQGLLGGARDADVVGDVLKEFTLKAQEGSGVVAAAFGRIGISADKMATAIATGGPAAKAALDLVLDRLRLVEDPAERARISVQLFGTQAEDLQQALLALDPSSAAAGLGDIAEAADRMNTVVGDNSSTAFESFKRKAEQSLAGVAGAFAPIIGGALDLAPALGGLALVAPHLVGAAKSAKDFVTTAGPMPGILSGIGGNAATAAKFLGGIGLAVGVIYGVKKGLDALGLSARGLEVDLGDVASAADTELVSAFTKLEKIGQGTAFFNKILSESPSEARRLIGALKDAGVETERYQASLDKSIASHRAVSKAKEEDSRITAGLSGVTAGLSSEVSSLTDAVGGQSTVFDDTTESIESYDDAMNRLVGVHVAAQQAAIDYASTFADLNAAFAENGRSLDLGTEAGRKNREAILGVITAATDHIGAMRDEGATAEELRATFAAHRGELANVLRQLGLNKDEAGKYLGLLDKVPASVLTTVKADTEPARKSIADFVADVKKDLSLALSIGTASRPLPKFHDGGIVPGPPGSEMLAVLQAGERVTAAAEVGKGAGVGEGLPPVQLNVSVLHEEDTAVETSRALANALYLVGA